MPSGGACVGPALVHLTRGLAVPAASSSGVGGGGGRLLFNLPLKVTPLQSLCLSSLLHSSSLFFTLLHSSQSSSLFFTLLHSSQSSQSSLYCSLLMSLPQQRLKTAYLNVLLHESTILFRHDLILAARASNAPRTATHHAALVSGAHAGITLTHMVPPSRLSCGWHVSNLINLLPTFYPLEMKIDMDQFIVTYCIMFAGGHSPQIVSKVEKDCILLTQDTSGSGSCSPRFGSPGTSRKCDWDRCCEKVPKPPPSKRCASLCITVLALQPQTGANLVVTCNASSSEPYP